MDNSIKNTNGKNTQQWVEAYLKAEGIPYKKNIWAPTSIYAVKKAHFLLNNRMYIITAGDLFNGGSQATMLELILRGSLTWKMGQIFFVQQRASMPADGRKVDAYNSVKGLFAGDIEDMRRIYNGFMS